MNKIAQYINEHILGEVFASDSIKNVFSRDGSILRIKPELVIHPRVTNDIRKIARFSWQLAEKGHILPITTRGYGSDKTGASIGKGIIVNTLAHLNKIIFVSLKNKDQFIHVQPGVRFDTLNEVLKSNDMIIPTFPDSAAYTTIGGAVSNNSGGSQSGMYGNTGDFVKRLEVVIANGDLIETGRINKHELNRKKGLQTFEGELYRKLDGIIEDNQEIIENKIANNSVENVGYAGVSKVKGRDGSFDLTPLFVGSQGTLGIISEIMLKINPYSSEESLIVATFDRAEAARDAADSVAQIKPSILDVIDGEYFDIAHSLGKKYIFTDVDGDKKIESVVFICLNDANEHERRKKLKQTIKKLSKLNTTIYTNEDYSDEELYAIQEVSSVVAQHSNKGDSSPAIMDGASVPSERREEFVSAVNELAKKHHINLPIQFRWTNGTVKINPTLQLNTVSDRQKTFKLIAEYFELVTRLGGSMCADSGEGRLKTAAAYAQLDEDVIEIYTQIKAAFDPFGILNPGVKQKTDLKTLVSCLNPEYDLADFAKYSPLA